MKKRRRRKSLTVSSTSWKSVPMCATVLGPLMLATIVRAKERLTSQCVQGKVLGKSKILTDLIPEVHSV